MKCGFCNSNISKNIQLKELVSLTPIIRNACCDSCYMEMNPSEKDPLHHCQFCQKKVQRGNESCTDCQNWQSLDKMFYLKHEFLFEYNQKMKDYFQQYKFVGDIRMSQTFRGDVNKHLLNYQKQDFLIIPIPVSKERLKERGFNQVEEILKSSLISYEPLLLKKETKKSQSEKNKEERLLTKQSFFIKGSRKKELKDKKILIVDDVYTTGRTLLHGYDCVLMCEPREIRSFSVSR